MLEQFGLKRGGTSTATHPETMEDTVVVNEGGEAAIDNLHQHLQMHYAQRWIPVGDDGVYV